MSASTPTEPVVLKLGGSAITVKDRPETLDESELDRISTAIATALADGVAEALVLVHGGGSFGHHHASEHGVSVTDGTHDPTAVREIHEAMVTLNAHVVDRLAARDVPAVGIDPFSVASRDGDGDLDLPTDQVTRLVDEGFVPVLHGDVVVHADEGATVVSGDELVVSLARSLGATRVGLCSTVPGVLDADGRVIERIDSFEAVESVLGASDATDVTGGMAAKVRSLLALDAEASIFGPDQLEPFLAGDEPGTTVGRTGP